MRYWQAEVFVPAGLSGTLVTGLIIGPEGQPRQASTSFIRGPWSDHAKIHRIIVQHRNASEPAHVGIGNVPSGATLAAVLDKPVLGAFILGGTLGLPNPLDVYSPDGSPLEIPPFLWLGADSGKSSSVSVAVLWSEP